MRSLIWFAVFAAVGSFSPAVGAEPKEVARQHFARGEALARAGLFADAYVEFESGYELSRFPLFLFNMGECARQAGQVERARAAYERYLVADPTGKRATTARARLRALPTVVTAPVPAPTILEPRPPVVRQPAPGLARPAGEPPDRHAAMLAPSPRPRASSSPSRWRRWPLWAGLGAAVVVGSVAIYAGTSGDDGCGDHCADFRP